MRLLAQVLRAPLTTRTWRETLHLLLGAVVSAIGLALAVAAGYAALASITVVGLALLGAVVVAARWIGAVERTRARTLLGLNVAGPQPRGRRHAGAVGWVRDALADTVGWRCLLYALIAVPVGLLQAYLVGMWWLISLAATAYPLWSWLPPQTGGHRSDEVRIGGWHWFPDTWPYPLLVCAIGLIGAFAAPWLVAGLAALDRWRLRTLLAPPAPADDAAASKRRRTRAIEQTGSQLRRIERDLHDGAQARMVAVALELGRARDDIESGESLQQVGARIIAAHDDAKQALVELRDLARGIYPAVLNDLGLDGAVPLLTARCAVPIHLDLDISARPDPAVEANAYFCIAELLTNIAKHSQATSASVRIRREEDHLSIEVDDDGQGGATPGIGTGLDGLAARVDSIGGTMVVSSPVGGPTRVRIELPCAL